MVREHDSKCAECLAYAYMNKNNNEPSPQVELQGKVLRQQHIRAVITLQADSVVLPQYGILGDVRYEFKVIKRKEITIPCCSY